MTKGNLNSGNEEHQKGKKTVCHSNQNIRSFNSRKQDIRDVTYKPVSFNKIGYTSESKVENLVSTLCLARFALSLQKF